MSLAIKFEDTTCESISIGSSWKNKIKSRNAESQTPEEMYQFEEAETQSGLHTELVEEVVSKKDTGFTLLDYLCEYRDNRSREVGSVLSNKWLRSNPQHISSVSCCRCGVR